MKFYTKLKLKEGVVLDNEQQEMFDKLQKMLFNPPDVLFTTNETLDKYYDDLMLLKENLFDLIEK